MENWWKEPDIGVLSCPVPAGEDGAAAGCAARRMWRAACTALVAPDAERAWQQLVDASPPDSLWHSLRNCVAYQAGVWQNLLNRGIDDVIQPAAFKLAIVLRHTPSELAVKLLGDLLRLHPQSQDLTSYILALLTDDEAAWCGGGCGGGGGDEHDELPSSSTVHTPHTHHTHHTHTDDDDHVPDSTTDPAGDHPSSTTDNSQPQPSTPAGPAPLRDLQLFGDCELAVLAASREEYDAHAKLVRAEYSKLTHDNYVELRIRVLNQFSQIPKLFHTAEFSCFESAARENISREITTLREHLLTGTN